MKKKILALVLVVVMAATAVVGGTMAYLTDEDSDVNVMTLGNVKIELIEQQRSDGADSDLEPFKDDKALYPIVGSAQGDKDKWGMPTAANYVDKIVSVKNTGVSDAYIRVLVAVPAALENEDASKNALHWNLGNRFDVQGNGAYNEGDVSQSDYNYVIKTETQAEKDGIIYNVYSFTYNTALTPGDTFDATIIGFYLDANLDNEDGKYVLNGNVIDYDISKGVQIPVMAQAIQTAGFASAAAAFEASGMTTNPWDGAAGTWDGTVDVAMFLNEDGTFIESDEYIINTAEQLAGFAELVNAGHTFEGKTVKLGSNVDLSGYNFTPIGGLDKDAWFEGTFDGQGHTISGLTENGWELGYEYGEKAGMGLFGWTYNSTIKNVTIDNAEISMEAVVMGVVAGYATGNCTFENITISNTQIANYNWDTGGIVGQVYGADNTFTFKNINIDDSTTISGHWGTWDVSAGGVIGRTANGVNVEMEDVTVAAVLDVYNDVCAAYQWYAYRYSGMLVGYTKTTETVDGRTVATAPHVTCKNVTVIYGDWANYTYCQPSNVAPQYVRVQGGYSTDPYYSGRHWTAGVDAAGNKMVDDNHVHAEGEAHNELIVFDQLFGGGQGVYGTATHDGVTVIYNNK